MVERAPDGFRTGLPLERFEEMRLEALGAERDARHAVAAEQRRELGGDGLGVRLDRDLAGRREAFQEAGQRPWLRVRRRPAAEEHGLEPLGQQVATKLELGQQRIDVRLVAVAAPDERDEVAVAAAVGAERNVHVEVADAAHLRSPSRLRTARNASCGTSTAPTCFMRFLPFFWRSSSLRLREMSPP